MIWSLNFFPKILRKSSDSRKQGIGDFVFGDIRVAGNNTVRIEIVKLARLKLVGTTDRAEQVVDRFGRLLCAVASNPAIGIVGVAEPACVLAGDQRREGIKETHGRIVFGETNDNGSRHLVLREDFTKKSIMGLIELVGESIVGKCRLQQGH